MASTPQAEPAVLLVGAGAAMQAALTQALDRHGVFVETSPADAVVNTVVAAAPDLILLVGDAARDCGSEVLTELAASPLSSVVPVAILDDNTALDGRLKAFRHGAAAIIPNSASADAIADQVARLAREIPERGGGSLGNLGESTLEDLITALGKELRSGVLSVRSEQESEAEAVRLVLGGGRPLTEVIDEFVSRVRSHIVLAEPLRYEFDERAGGTVQLLGGEDAPSNHEDVHDLRILLADDDAARADAVAQQLRGQNATVMVTDLDPTAMRFERLRQLDPTVLLIGEEQLQGLGYDLIRRMRRDTRLRWASLLVVRWDEVWADDANVPAVDRLLGTLNDLAEPERAVSARADAGEPFDTRLEAMGPTRLLRALTSCSHPLRLTVFNPRVQVSLEISNELLVSANTHVLGRHLEQLEGAAALSAFVVLGSGRAHVEAVEQPTSTNMMAPIDVALDMADAEPPPIPPSLPSPASDSVRPPIAGALARGAAGVPAIAAPAQPAPAAPPAAAAPAAAAPVPRPAPAPRPAPVPPPAPVPRPAPAPIAQTQPVEPAPVALPTAIAQPDADAIPLQVGPLGKAHRWLDESTRPGSPPRGLVAWLVPVALLQAAALLLLLFSLSPSTKHQRSTTKSVASATAPASSASAPAPSGSAAPAKSASGAHAAPPAANSSDGTHPPVADTSLPVIHHARAPSCNQLLAKEPPRRDGYPGAAYRAIKQARRGLMRGDVDAAERSYCRAAAFDSGSVTAAVELTRVFLLRRDGRAAAVWARRAGKRGADDATVNGLLGDGYALSGLFQKARSAWVEANGGQPADPEGEAALASKSRTIGRNALRVRAYSRAERYFRRAIVLAPEHASAAIGIARTLLMLDVPADAMSWARYAVAVAPRNADAQVALGDALNRKGQHVEASRAWKKALELQPGNPAAEARLKRLGSR